MAMLEEDLPSTSSMRGDTSLTRRLHGRGTKKPSRRNKKPTGKGRPTEAPTTGQPTFVCSLPTVDVTVKGAMKFALDLTVSPGGYYLANSSIGDIGGQLSYEGSIFPLALPPGSSSNFAIAGTSTIVEVTITEGNFPFTLSIGCPAI